MREGWTYKKLGEVAKISSGKAIPSSDIIDTFSEGFYPCYGGNGLRGYVDHFSNDGLVPVIGRVGALCGNVHLPQGKFYATEHALVVYLKTKDKPHYIEYLLSSLNLRQYAKGVAQPVLSASTLSEITIPIPPLSEQQRIVNELDLLSSIIDKKKAQLKEYDQFAQSIFYDMFGDPVTNEKGWEVKKLGEVCEILAGGDKPANISNVRTKDYCFPVIANGDGEKGILGYSRTRRIIKDSVTIGARGASIGNCRIVYGGFTPVVRLITLTPDSSVNCSYLFYFANLMPYNSNGAGQAQLTVPNVRNVSFPLPPLSLQQSFASKIEAIERQKALVQQSITEAETLFNSRMDYWFS